MPCYHVSLLSERIRQPDSCRHVEHENFFPGIWMLMLDVVAPSSWWRGVFGRKLSQSRMAVTNPDGASIKTDSRVHDFPPLLSSQAEPPESRRAVTSAGSFFSLLFFSFLDCVRVCLP